MEGAGPVLPTQGPFCQPTPVTILSLLVLLSCVGASIWRKVAEFIYVAESASLYGQNFYF